jgi:hypothetical protein
MSLPPSGSACYPLYAGFLLGFWFFRNVSGLWMDYMVYIPKNITLQKHCYEDFKSYTFRLEVLTAFPEDRTFFILAVSPSLHVSAHPHCHYLSSLPQFWCLPSSATTYLTKGTGNKWKIYFLPLQTTSTIISQITSCVMLHVKVLSQI